MKKHFFSLICLTGCIMMGIVPMQAQYNLPAKPSADAMMTVNSILQGVDYSSGIANIQVPLHEINFNGIHIPISISYQASGIKVEDQPGILGMGWRLCAGGKITRIVKQRPDGASGRMGGTIENAYNSFFNNIGSNYRYYNGLNSEPDLFFFEIPGMSGMFVFDQNGVARTIPHQNISIQWGGLHFTIKDERGNTYVFGGTTPSVEKTTTSYHNSNYKPNNGIETSTYTSTWHLDEITTYYGDKVTFTYEKLAAREYTSNNIMFFCEYREGPGLPQRNVLEEVPSDAKSIIEECFLKGIDWESGAVRFYQKTGNPRILEKVSVFSHSNPASGVNGGYKNMLFEYTAINSSGRFKLSQIQEQFGLTSTRPFCSFTYNTRTLEHSSTRNYDHWGYYNAASNTTHRPTFNNLEGASREPDFGATAAEILTAINYPMGGSIEYMYELNQYNKNGTSTNTGGLRIKEIHRKDGTAAPEITRYEYLLPNGKSSGYIKNEIKTGYVRTNFRYEHNGYRIIPFTISSKPLNDIFEVGGQHVSYSRVTEILPDGTKIIYNFTNPQEDPVTADELSLIRYSITPQIVPNPTNIQNNPSSDNLFMFYPNSSKQWRRNLLKSQLIISGMDTVSHAVYHYKINEAPRSVISGFIPFYHEDKFISKYLNRFVCKYEWECQPVYLERIENKATAYNLPSETVFTYNTQYMVPTQIIETDAESNITKTITKYPFDYVLSEFSASYDTYGLYLLKEGGIVSPIETVVYRNNKVISGKIQEFTTHKIGTTQNITKAVPWKEHQLTLSDPINDYQNSSATNLKFNFDSRYELQRTNTKFDQNANISSYQGPTGENYAMLYDEHGRMVAFVENAVKSWPSLSEQETIKYDTLKQTSKGFSFRSQDFTIPYDQNIQFILEFIYASGYPRPNGQNYTFMVKKTNTNNEVYRTTMTDRTMWYTDLTAGSYYVQIESLLYDKTTEVKLTCRKKQKVTLLADQETQVFYTSFEDASSGTYNRNALSGEYVRQGTYTVSLSNYPAGNYILSYWKSPVGGNNWQKITQQVTRNNSVTIGDSNSWIDEVRVHPADARMTTYTYAADGSILSETDNTGQTMKYEYDRNRLYRIWDKNRNLLKEYQYKSKNDPTYYYR